MTSKIPFDLSTGKEWKEWLLTLAPKKDAVLALARAQAEAPSWWEVWAFALPTLLGRPLTQAEADAFRADPLESGHPGRAARLFSIAAGGVMHHAAFEEPLDTMRDWVKDDPIAAEVMESHYDAVDFARKGRNDLAQIVDAAEVAYLLPLANRLRALAKLAPHYHPCQYALADCQHFDALPGARLSVSTAVEHLTTILGPGGPTAKEVESWTAAVKRAVRFVGTPKPASVPDLAEVMERWVADRAREDLAARVTATIGAPPPRRPFMGRDCYSALGYFDS